MLSASYSRAGPEPADEVKHGEQHLPPCLASRFVLTRIRFETKVALSMLKPASLYGLLFPCVALLQHTATTRFAVPTTLIQEAHLPTRAPMSHCAALFLELKTMTLIDKPELDWLSEECGVGPYTSCCMVRWKRSINQSKISVEVRYRELE